VKRHPGLRPLSDDHHAALVLARRTRAAAQQAGSLESAWEELRGRFARELEPHFRVEEADLFPPLGAAGAEALVEQALAHHARLRQLVSAEADRERALELAELLHRHVRFEERELFPRAERLLPASVLDAVGRAARERPES
jgi:hypothetical protein